VSDLESYRMTYGFNATLFRYVLRYLEPSAGERILDAGCGRGFYVKALERYTDGTVGVDISGESIATAVSDSVETGDVTNLRFADATFDKVLSLHTIEHIPDLQRFISEIGRVLKPGGLAVLVYPWELFRGMQAIGAAVRNYGNPFLAGRIHVHRLTPNRIKKLVTGSVLSHRESRFVPAVGLQYLSVLDR